MLKAKIDGTVLAVYDRETRTQEGKYVVVHCVDLYVGHDLVKVSKLSDDVKVAVGEALVDFPVKVYNGQYGLSCVYDDEMEGGAT